jgi:dienelactone hydrolase
MISPQSRRTFLATISAATAVFGAAHAFAAQCPPMSLAGPVPGCPPEGKRLDLDVPAPMDGYTSFSWSHGDISRLVYRRGEGPGVLVMHELPGMTPECLRLADRIRERGYAVYLPLFFGQPGESGGALRLPAVCLRREFRCLASERSSPITPWLRSLTAHIFEERGGPGVGVIGMCMTGGLVIPLMLDAHVLAPVASQPSLPFALLPWQRHAVGVSDEEMRGAALRARSGVPVIGFRFTEDWRCPPERFATLCARLGASFRPYEIDSSANNRFCIPSSAHSVLTHAHADVPGHPTHDAVAVALAFLDERLRR